MPRSKKPISLINIISGFVKKKPKKKKVAPPPSNMQLCRIGTRIHNIRKKVLKLTLQELGELSKTSLLSVWKAEHAKLSPRSRALKKILLCLNISTKPYKDIDHVLFWSNFRFIRKTILHAKTREVAPIFNISPAYLSQAENGLVPAYNIIEKAAKFVKLSIDDILNLKKNS